MSSSAEGPSKARPARHVVAIGSGKGGVGKSTVALNTALALAERGGAVGILDADIYGPNIPLLVNLARTRTAKGWTLWRRDAPKIRPVEKHGLRIFSSGFIVAEGQAVNWDAPLVRSLVTQLVRGVDWGGLDYLIVDLPPGTSDILQELTREAELSGVALVVTPQDVAHLDARKALEACRRASATVLGAVENMSALRCPHCGEVVEVFRPVREDRSIWHEGIERLGTIPLDPEISELGDRGSPLMVARPDSPQADAFRELAVRLSARVGD